MVRSGKFFRQDQWYGIGQPPAQRIAEHRAHGAIDHAMSLFRQGPFKSERQVIDISGDGSNNTGRSVVRARDEAVAKDVTINGLPILAVEPYLDRYYHDFVIGGPGAFMVVAKDFESFGEAILKKLIIEIAGRERRPRGIANASSLAVDR